MFIAFLGCDGSGKSTIIHRITEELTQRQVPIILGHWRPTAIHHHTNHDVQATADDPHRQQARGTISSLLKLGWLWLNWWLGWHQSLKSNAKNGMLIFDRYHADLLVDPIRYRYGGPMILAKLASRLMPQPDIVFFLDAPPEVLYSRKQEVSLESLQRSRTAYLRLKSIHKNFVIIDATQPIESVLASVLAHLSSTSTD